MRVPSLAAAALVAVLSAPASAAGTPGPFAGVIGQGENRAHSYSNNPAGLDCIALAVTYTVGITHVPGSDVLTLHAGGKSVQTVNGSASVSFWGSYCDSFGIGVTGTSVAGPKAAYVVSVGSGSQGAQ